MKKLILLGLLAACGSTGGTGSRYVAVTQTFPVNSGSTHMTTSTWTLGGGTKTNAELRIQDGTLLVRFDDCSVQLDMSDFPGDSMTMYSESLELPLVLDLPDGTRFVFRGTSFEVGDETYEIEPGAGVVSYAHPGMIISP